MEIEGRTVRVVKGGDGCPFQEDCEPHHEEWTVCSLRGGGSKPIGPNHCHVDGPGGYFPDWCPLNEGVTVVKG